jgi:hypothetical protein
MQPLGRARPPQGHSSTLARRAAPRKLLGLPTLGRAGSTAGRSSPAAFYPCHDTDGNQAAADNQTTGSDSGHQDAEVPHSQGASRAPPVVNMTQGVATVEGSGIPKSALGFRRHRNRHRREPQSQDDRQRGDGHNNTDDQANRPSHVAPSLPRVRRHGTPCSHPNPVEPAVGGCPGNGRAPVAGQTQLQVRRVRRKGKVASVPRPRCGRVAGLPPGEIPARWAKRWPPQLSKDRQRTWA